MYTLFYRKIFFILAISLVVGMGCRVWEICEVNPNTDEYIQVKKLIKCPNTFRRYEGQAIKVWGYVEFVNIFDPREYPNEDGGRILLKEKATTDTGNGIFIYLPEDQDNSWFFDILQHEAELQPQATNPKLKLYAEGMLYGFDMPTNFSNTRGHYVAVDDVRQHIHISH